MNPGSTSPRPDLIKPSVNKWLSLFLFGTEAWRRLRFVTGEIRNLRTCQFEILSLDESEAPWKQIAYQKDAI